MKNGVVLELEKSVLLELIKNGSLSLNDFRCTNKQSKEYVWSCYLKAAQRKPLTYHNFSKVSPSLRAIADYGMLRPVDI